MEKLNADNALVVKYQQAVLASGLVLPCPPPTAGQLNKPAKGLIPCSDRALG